jgi:hypothetical protein
MIRILRAFAWLRWRMLINSFEHTGARDVVERFSLAVEKLGPIIAAILLIPSAIALAGVGIAGGFALARGQATPLLFELSRYLLLIVPLVAIVGPLLLPAADRTNPIRMLLLPIPRSTLYVAQAASALGDPWMLLALPLLAGIPIGLAAGGGGAAGALMALASLAFLVVLLGIAAVATTLLHLAVRDRRRGELLALLFLVVLPLVSMLPGLMDGNSRRRAREEGRTAAAERPLPEWVVQAGQRAYRLMPAELYARAARSAARDSRAAAVPPLAALAAGAIFLHGVGFLAFRRVLDAPGSSGARRSTPMREVWGRTVPGLSPAASAVALAQLRLALRTPRGRSIMLSPLMLLGIFAIVMIRNGQGMEFGFVSLNSGLGLATFTAFVAVMSILPLAFNQFAIDGAGLTFALLSPMSTRDYLSGKAVGNALVVLPATMVCVLVSYAVFPAGPIAMWLSVPIAMLAVYLPVAPAAAIFSALLPRQVDMNSIGNKSNAHGLAGLLGLLGFMLAGVPCALVTLAATRLLDRPSLAPLFLLAWCAIAYAIGRALFVPARRVFEERRENLSMLM